MQLKPPNLEDYGRLLLIEFIQYRRLKAAGLNDSAPELSCDLVSWIKSVFVPPAERTFYPVDIVWEKWVKILDEGTEADVMDFPRWMVEDLHREQHEQN
jgi:hypothetical protein